MNKPHAWEYSSFIYIIAYAAVFTKEGGYDIIFTNPIYGFGRMSNPAYIAEDIDMSHALRSLLRPGGTLMGERAFYSQVVSIVVPIVIQNTVSNVVNLLDNVMVGAVGTLEMSSVAIVNQLLFIFNLCIFGGLAGAGIFSTQYAGAKNDDGVRHCFRIKWMIVVAMLAAALAVFLTIPEQLIRLYLADGTNEADALATMGFSLDYLRVMLWGLLPFAVAQVYAGTLREVGETKLPMTASIIGILTNLVFNYLLIFGHFGFPRWGVTGAAVATVISRYVEVVIIVAYTHRRSFHFTFIRGAYRTLKVPRALLLDVGKRGMPLLVNEFFWSCGIALLLQCYSVRGLNVVAACNIASTVSNLFKVIFMSMGNAVAIMVGQDLGAGRLNTAKQTAWRLMFLSLMTNLVMGAMLAVFAPFIPLIYNTETVVREMATELLYVIAIMMPVYSVAHCCYFTLRSGGRTIMTFVFDSGFTWGVCVPVAWVIAYMTSMTITPFYFIVQALELIKVVIGFILVKKGVWIRNIVSGKAGEAQA